MFGRTKSVNSIVKTIHKSVEQLKKRTKAMDKKVEKTNKTVEKLHTRVTAYKDEASRADLIASNFLALIGEKPAEQPLTEPTDSA